jgi:hypothetical protein
MTTDFRSDTVTRPTAAMRAAMAEAPVGDDVFGDDPSVNALEAEVAALLGFETAMYVPSGTQSNLIGVMTHCARGDEVILGQESHNYRYEAGGGAVLGSIQPQPLDNAADGTIPIAAIDAAIKPDDSHFARTRLIALENTIGGKVLPEGYVAEVRAARATPPRAHLDGARLVECGGEARRRAEGDCAGLRFGFRMPVERLGAPVGSALRRARLRQGGAALAQDAGRRHAASRSLSSAVAVMRSRITSNGLPKITTTQRCSLRPGSIRRPRVDAADQHGVRRCTRAIADAFAKHLDAQACRSLGRPTSAG